MPGGRPRKRRHFNFNKEDIQAMPAGTNNESSISESNDKDKAACQKNNQDQSSSVQKTQRTASLRANAIIHSVADTENVEEHLQTLQDQRQRASQRLDTESQTARLHRLEDLRQRASQRLDTESQTARLHRLEDLRQRASHRLDTESQTARLHRLEDLQQRASHRRATETATENTQRLEEMRQRASQRLVEETRVENAKRLEEQRRRNARQRAALQYTRKATHKRASTSDTNTTYNSLGTFDVSCIHCGALHFPEERVCNKTHRDSFGDCCLHGRIRLEAPKFPNELILLYLRRHPLAAEFHKRIRNLNSSFALASFNMEDNRTINSHGIYSFMAAGMVYHKINLAAHPTQNSQGQAERPQYGQIYYLDSEPAVTERLNHPFNKDMNQNIVNIVEEIMRTQNIFVKGFLMMREVEEAVNRLASTEGVNPPYVKLVFTEPDGADLRRYNVPSSNEVCAVVTLNADQSLPESEMVVHQRGKEIITLKNTDQRVEPFTYPLFYPDGTFGYSVKMQLHTPYPSRQHLTRLELAQYRIAFRPALAKHLPRQTDLDEADLRLKPFNAIHFGGRLFQQYLVDTYIRVERDRIQWIKHNQKKILGDRYTGVNQFLKELSMKKNAVIGETIILPSSFPGSTRFYAEHFEDAMAIVRRFGSPDFFITMSSNPDWPEIKEAKKITFEDGLVTEQQTQDRPDLVARVAKLKFDNIVADFHKNEIFGKAAAYVYTVEFQKRGLPHMHLLLIMSPEDKIHNPEQIDDIIAAEIPDEQDPHLRELVLKWMIHNPCGQLNPNASCMVNKNGRMQCRFDFPKSFQDVTSLVDDERPKLRRRYVSKLDQSSSDFSHEHAVYRKDINGSKVTRDNRHVASYNPYLLKRYNCHINVEYVGSIRAVKYLYKYIYKGHDCASIQVIENENRLIYNEADTYIEGRCIGPPEACWRLFCNEIQKKSHVVQRLDIHLPGEYRIGNIDRAQEDLADIGLKGSTLEAYFKTNCAVKEKLVNSRLNGEEDDVTYRHYWQIPEHFKWVGATSEWVRRIRRVNVIGRIHNVNFVAQPELYHLRLLLYHVNDATCFEDLLKVDGVRHATYKQACLARGLAFDDQQWIDGLRESAMSKAPRAMRTLFSQILILGSPENPKRLWETFKEDLAEDFIREAKRSGEAIEEAIKRAYRVIAYKLNTEATEGRNFRYWVQRFGMDEVDDYENDPNQHSLHPDESSAVGEEMYGLLRGKQLEIVDRILDSANGNLGGKCFFIDGPGGTGKTFIYKTLYHILRGKGYYVKCMAFTGIASILLPEGQTSHRVFGLSVPLTPESISNIKPGSTKANQLAKVDVFLMDEAPMLPKYGLHNIDQLLRAIGNSSLPFGGKVVVLGGDFRQCLPVQPRANRSELLDLSIKRSNLWQHFAMFSLKVNMRVDQEETEFAEFLLKLGNGELPENALNEIKIPTGNISNGNLIDEVFGNILTNHNYEAMKERAILAPLNKDVNIINLEIIKRLPGEEKSYFSFDSIKDQAEDALQFTTEFLNSIDIADLPPHELKLKKNAIIMLMRNLDTSEGLCNGTRLLVTELCNNVIKAQIITGEHSGREVHIPRITLDSIKSKLGSTMQRHQFPVTPAFAMTVHKSQGQTFQFVGIDLRVPVFMHGMLYVAFSRVKRQSSLRVLLPPDNDSYTRNIVWKEILNQDTRAVD